MTYRLIESAFKKVTESQSLILWVGRPQPIRLRFRVLFVILKDKRVTGFDL